MLTYRTILAKLEENKATIKKYGVKRIGLFGSYIREEQKSTSDIDILCGEIFTLHLSLHTSHGGIDVSYSRRRKNL
jgi:predicted nucleotidyltransferase